MAALPPATLEGWYVLHQAFSFDWNGLRKMSEGERAALAADAEALFAGFGAVAEGWSDHFRLVGGGADVMFVHFRAKLEELADVQLAVRRSALGEVLRLELDYLSVTEAGLYHATAEAAKENAPASDGFKAAIKAAGEAELGSPHIRTRLFPRVPEGMRYVSFYPMSKRRVPGQNWYTLPIDERNRLMREHGMTGRGFAGRIFQVITGSVGLDDWEWGVTLFARDPLDFKRIVTDMRYDEASAEYGEFGAFYTGIRFASPAWTELLGGTGTSV
ncbi:MAG TPA: hydrogen peroxide-dependent heme synthase [Longimicrobiaceae bacterium]|jgi:chlorite dismutase|nr:hydrogen peroxide-dependent heme synthase [Longimicrobiaceae bacterium]